MLSTKRPDREQSGKGGGRLFVYRGVFMSVKIMSQVFDCNMPELKTDKGETVSDSAGKFVLLALADHASEDGEGCYPGVRRICRKTNLSIGTVVKALNALRHNGFTQLEGQSRRKTFNYTVLVARIAEFQWLEQSDSSGYNSSVLATRAKPSLTALPTPKKNDEAALATISRAYESEIGVITGMIRDELIEASTSYPLQWTKDAIHEAAIQNKRGWKYVLAILTRWKAQGNQETMKLEVTKYQKPAIKTNNDEAIRSVLNAFR
jgi:DnaD/phage-associated family protein